MAPEFVVAHAPYKKYPGGVVVLRCSDWLGPARGTLSTETDSTSCNGIVVRDAQKTTASVYDTWVQTNDNAFVEADDTLVVDLATLPLEDGFKYLILVSFKIDGDWNPDNGQTAKGGTQATFGGGADLRFYGDQFVAVDETDTLGLNAKWRKCYNYRISGYGGNWNIGPIDMTEVLHFRAYSQVGTTAEWLLDQIYFLPNANGWGSTINGWNGQDFELIPGQQGTFSGFYNLQNAAGDPATNWVDGADGGDGISKFTWHPVSVEEPTGISGGDGGGDYQQDDSEYFARVRAGSDFYVLTNSQLTWPDNEPSASHMYGVHGPFFVPTEEWTQDTFDDRTIGANSLGAYGGGPNGAHAVVPDSGWRKTPQGFYWRDVSGSRHYDWLAAPYGAHRHGHISWVDGTRAGLKVVHGGLDEVASYEMSMERGYGGDGSGPEFAGAGIWADDLIIRGEVEIVQEEAPTSGPPDAINEYRGTLYIGTGFINNVNQPNAVHLQVRLGTQKWAVFHPYDAGVPFSGWFTVPWLLTGVSFGFQLEVFRHTVRCSVWEVGSEPGIPDFQGHRPIIKSGVKRAYPYNNDLEYSILDYDAMYPRIIWNPSSHEYAGILACMFEHITVKFNAHGNQGSAWANIEKPEGNELGRVEMPDCQHMVFWGTRDWTDFIPGDGSYIDFSQKLWNDAGSALMQRSEAFWWWFRSVHAFDLAPVFWNPYKQLITEKKFPG